MPARRDALVVVVHGHRKRASRVLLANHVAAQRVVDLLRRGDGSVSAQRRAHLNLGIYRATSLYVAAHLALAAALGRLLARGSCGNSAARAARALRWRHRRYHVLLRRTSRSRVRLRSAPQRLFHLALHALERVSRPAGRHQLAVRIQMQVTSLVVLLKVPRHAGRLAQRRVVVKVSQLAEVPYEEDDARGNHQRHHHGHD